MLGTKKYIFISNYLLLLILFTCSCSSTKPTEELKKELNSVSSWAATVHMVADAWQRHAVPTSYAKDTLQKTQKELQKETDTLLNLSIVPSQRHTALEQLQQLQKTIDKISILIEQKNRNAIATQIKQLSATEQKIHQLAQATGEAP
ncbi:hypothetical protein [Fischerella sp. JS2]|uniref:hypothetical protein n=1 Tax=Fischerella sp. JS2 TaxID=2597771 RepID=UPI0028E61FFC|nr:hypothetical protein [Fischerella sp. JS2]